MKKTVAFFTWIFLLFISQVVFAQLKGFNYQAVAIDENGKEIVGMDISGQAIGNKTIAVRFSILSGSTTGTLLYQETHTTNTDRFGLFSLIIGDGSVSNSGQYPQMIDIPWSAANQFLRVEIDIKNNGDYKLMSVQQLMAAPYTFYALKSDSALYSLNSGASAESGTLWKLSGNDSTTAGTNFIGTTDSVDFVVKTNNTEGLRLSANGNVSIGSVIPTSPLTIQTKPGSDLEFVSSGDSADIFANSVLNIGSSSSIHLMTNDSINLSIDSSGNTGIGTSSPSEKLDVSGNGRFSGLAGSTTRILQTDLNGKLIPLAADSADKVLLGTGVWGSVPANTTWSLTGNSGTFDTANFIGTLDDKPFNIRINNEKAGRIDRQLYNAFWGFRAGTQNSSGYGNTAIGTYSLDFNTTGFHNTSMGDLALTYTTTGSSNTSVGAKSMYYNTFGNFNTAFGKYALSDNTIGNNNTSIGTNSFYSNSTGNNNVALGYNAGFHDTTGSGNVFLGYEAGYNELGSNKLYIANDSINPPLIFGDFSAGNVGIGTITPGATLEIAGQVKITGGTPGAGKVLTADATGLATWITPTAGTVTTINGMAPVLATSSDGATYAISVSDNSQSSPGTVAAGGANMNAVWKTDASGNPAWRSDSASAFNAGTGLSLSGTTFNSVWTATGADIFNNNSGNIGIGTTTPTEKLDITGNIRVSNLAATNTRMVQTDLNGTLVPLPADSSYKVLLGTGVWGSVPTKTAWSLLGNSGTVDGINFIGTTDGTPLNIRVNNQKAGKIDHLLFNTFFGLNAGNSTTAGNANTANGFGALRDNTTGNYNTANGFQALYSNVAGSKATAIGVNAMQYSYNTSSVFDNANVAVGFEALRGSSISANNNGNYNTAIGFQTLRSNSAGSQNVAEGYQALYTNTGGSSNTAIGFKSLYFNSLGSYNTATGDSALYSNTIGVYNTATGLSALYSNTTGQHNTANGGGALHYNTTGKYNTAIGAGALLFNFTGEQNTAVGAGALYFNTIGAKNAATGNGSLYLNTTGSYNVAFGEDALHDNATGTYNTAVGYQSFDSGIAYTNSTALGYKAQITADNTIQLGNTSITDVKTSGTITANGYTTAYSTKSSAYTLTASDDIVAVTGNTTISLPTAVGITGRKYTIKNMDAALTVTISPNGIETIDGAATKLLTLQYQHITVVSDGANWLIVAAN